jgi:hypothetical protein
LEKHVKPNQIKDTHTHTTHTAHIHEYVYAVFVYMYVYITMKKEGTRKVEMKGKRSIRKEGSYLSNLVHFMARSFFWTSLYTMWTSPNAPQPKGFLTVKAVFPVYIKPPHRKEQRRNMSRQVKIKIPVNKNPVGKETKTPVSATPVSEKRQYANGFVGLMKREWEWECGREINCNSHVNAHAKKRLAATMVATTTVMVAAAVTNMVAGRRRWW